MGLCSVMCTLPRAYAHNRLRLSLHPHRPHLQQFLVGPVTNGKAVALSSMDPTDTTADALATQMMTQLNYSYNGNRAPMEIAVHTPWCGGTAGGGLGFAWHPQSGWSLSAVLLPATLPCRFTSNGDHATALTSFIKQVGLGQ